MANKTVCDLCNKAMDEGTGVKVYESTIGEQWQGDICPNCWTGILDKAPTLKSKRKAMRDEEERQRQALTPVRSTVVEQPS